MAISELRELARGIHPAVLSDRGLPAALESLADALAGARGGRRRCPAERLPEPVELAAYYVISEALTNVVKYADASYAKVNVVRDNGHVLGRGGRRRRGRGRPRAAAPACADSRTACARSRAGWRWSPSRAAAHG